MKWLVLCLMVLFPFVSHAEAVTDIRVLIDVSGSMKKNDPNNLRAPALKLLVGLLPKGSRAGIWTFGRYVNMQVKLDSIDDNWKKNAMAEASKIHSRGLYTNIEEAVKRASADWGKPDPRYKRHIILLTDGMVDIAKDAKLNEQSRRRLLQEILPKVEQADASIHTIALSNNVDTDLLNALSGATRGAFAQVNSAEELQRIFLKLFEKSVTADTVPIEDNKFRVDKHISDITVLVFLAKDSPPTQIILPDGKRWNQKSKPGNVQWHHEDGYDLITVKEPLAGEWTLKAKVDPDNRVMVVSNMRLKVDKLPNTLMLGDRFDIRSRLMEEGKTVTNQNLLSRTVFSARHPLSEGKIKTIELDDNGNTPDVLKGDGVYSSQYHFSDKPGEYELILQAKSQTFEREKRHTIQVHDSPANIGISQEAPDKPFKVVIHPHAGLIRPETVSMQIQLPDGQPVIVKQTDDLEWSIDVDQKFINKSFKLTLVGNRYNGKPVKLEFEQVLAPTDKEQSIALKVDPVKSEAEPEKPVQPPVNEETAKETEMSDDAGKDEKAVAGAEPPEEGFNWIMVIILVVVVNAIVITGGWYGFRYWKKRQTKEAAAVEAELNK